jgi:hypothetical protein
VIELRPRPINVPGMKEAREAIVRAVDGATDQGCDMRGSHESMSRDLAHHRNVVVRYAERRGSLCTSEPWSARRF